jgi:threonyl-tRNA synthetase
VASGSFVYDVDLGGHDWTPTKEELMVISAKMHRIAEADKPFERLVVDANLALEMFSENKHKKKQIPNIAKKSPSGT